MIRTAVILAAGLGMRLRSEVDDRPKGFLRFGERSIIEESVERLVTAGIQDIVIVTGHGAEHYDRFAADQDGLVRTVHNSRFSDSGSMYSLYCASDAVNESFLLLESDLIYEQRALTELLIEPAPDAILLSGTTGAGDEVWVETRDGNLITMSKNRDALKGPVAGELVGISRISTGLFGMMLDLAECAFEKSLHYDYETDCLVAAAAHRPIRCPVVSDLIWSEIDDPDHLQRAREQVYPSLVAVDST